jgi:general secretion pathway protein K
VFACMNYPNFNCPATRVRLAGTMGTPYKARGAVLILALLIVALVAGLGIKFASDYQLGLARAEGRWHGAQARAYVYSAEGFVITNLSKDSTNYDSLDELWAEPIPQEVEGGRLLISITDANSQFNLNNLATPLVAGKASGDATRYSDSQRMFIRLLQMFPELVPEPSNAVEIVESIVDWTDPDNDPSDNGAEESYYLSLVDPYQPANAPFRSIEELRLVRGITPELMQVLRPFITVFRDKQLMNVNTMAPIFYRCINVTTDLNPLPEGQAAALLPKDQSYKQKNEFVDAVARALGAGVAADSDFEVKTDLFWLTTRVEIGEQRRTARSLLHRDQPLFTVVRREEVLM